MYLAKSRPTTIFVCYKPWDPQYGHKLYCLGDILFIQNETSPGSMCDARIVHSSIEGIMDGWGMGVDMCEIRSHFRPWDGWT